MKKIFLFSILVFVLALTARAGVQTFALNGGTNSVALSSTNVLADGRNNNTGLFTSRFVTFHTYILNAGGGSTNNLTFAFDYSLDNTIWSSNAFLWVVAMPAASAAGVTTTNIDTYGVPYVRCREVRNTNGVAVATNVVLKAYSKPGI